MGSYKYLMVFMSATELGYSLIDVLLKPEVISIGDFWIVGTNSRKTSLSLWVAYPLVLLWGASYGVAVASFGVHFIFRYFMVIGDRRWVSGPINLLFWFTILVSSGLIYALTIHKFLHFDEVLEVLVRQEISSFSNIPFNEMVYYGFSLYQIRPSTQLNWINLQGVILMGSIVMLSLIIMVYFALHAYWAIQHWSSLSVSLSSLSKALQTQLFYSLVVQTVIPVILIHLPTTVIVVSSFFGTGQQIFGKIITVTISLFPAIDPLPSLIIIRPYREAIRAYGEQVNSLLLMNSYTSISTQFDSTQALFLRYLMCTWRNSYLESDEFYSLTLHLLSIIQVPLNIFGVYVVYSKTPKNMETVKFIMMLLHLTCFWLDVYFNILTIPYVVFPAASGYPLGLLLYLGVPTTVMTYIACTSLYLLGATFVTFFEDRYHRLVRRDIHTIARQRKRSAHFVVNYTAVFIFAIPCLLNIPSPQEARGIFQQDFACLPSSMLDKPGFLMLTTNTTVLVASLAGYLAFSGSQAAFFIYFTSEYLFKTKAQSQRTSQMQKQFFKALCIQASVPLLSFIVPCLYIQIAAAMNFVDMMYSNISMIWLTTHGIFSTVTMLIVHKPYRDAVLDMVRCKKSVTSVSSHNNSITRL